MVVAAAMDQVLKNDAIARRLARQYELTIKRIMRELAAGVSKAQAFRAEALIARMKVLLKQLDPRQAGLVQDWIQKELPKAYVHGDAETTRQLQAALDEAPIAAQRRFPTIDTRFTAINETALRGVIAAMESTMGAAKTQMEQVLGRVIRQTQTSLKRAAEIRDVTVSGFLRGVTPQAIADDIAGVLLGKALPAEVRARLEATGFNASMFQEFQAVAQSKLIQVGKRRYDVATYSRLVARTQLREVQQIAAITRGRQNGINHVQVLRHEQDHVDVCTAFMGRVFYTGEGEDPAGFPSYFSLPNRGIPFHPYCECNTKPYVLLLESPANIAGDRNDANLLPAEFFGSTSQQVTELVQGMSPDELRRIGLPASPAARGKKEAG